MARPPCNGKPLEGEGELQIRRRAGEQTVVGVLQGSFSKGALRGEGVKANLTYDKAGRPLPGAYVFQGTFANSVLHGQGMISWSGTPDDRPRAWARQGRFEHGIVRDGVTLSRLWPYPGVEAQLQELWYDERGNTYIEQAQVNRGQLVKGMLFFENDPVAWDTEVAIWRDGFPEAARFTRKDMARGDILIAGCAQWRFEVGRLACDKGAVKAGGLGSSIGINDGAYAVTMPLRAGAVPFRPGPSAQLTMGDESALFPARCDVNLERCTGKGFLPMLGSLLYWQGDMEWRDGALRPVSATLYQQPVPPQRKRIKLNKDGNIEAIDPQGATENYPEKAKQYAEDMRKTPFDPGGRDVRTASCERFESPVACSRGTVFRPGSQFVGAWRLDGVLYQSESDNTAPARYLPQKNVRVVPVGWGTNIFANGRWAEAHYDADGDIDKLGKCDDPGSSEDFRCELDGKTVIFYAQGNGQSATPQRKATAQAPVYTAPSAGNGRFVPQVEPQRPVFVLPGMR